MKMKAYLLIVLECRIEFELFALEVDEELNFFNILTFDILDFYGVV